MQRGLMTWSARSRSGGGSGSPWRAAAPRAHSQPDVGQAHNQLARAETQLGSQGYLVRVTIVTHLAELDPAAAASIGTAWSLTIRYIPITDSVFNACQVGP
jgi:hypothetical protein